MVSVAEVELVHMACGQTKVLTPSKSKSIAVRARAWVAADLGGTVEAWKAHQILAYRYEELSPNMFRIHVYDPNCPERDDVVIEASLVSVRSPFVAEIFQREAPVHGLEYVQRIPGAYDKPMRRFFLMPSMPVRPPERLR